MQLWHALLLGLVQGLTEFLPVSSTAHLTLAEHLLLGRGMPLAFDVLLHTGTLAALGVYFRREVMQVIAGILGRDEAGRRLALLLLAAMVPTGILALATRSFKEQAKGHLWIYGVCLLVTAALLWAANRLARRRSGQSMAAMTMTDALAIGSIQGLGGGFGLSRSGSTIAVGVFRGLALPDSTRFSFLLGMPTIAAAALVEARPMVTALLRSRPLVGDLAFPPGSASVLVLCAAGVAMAAVSGYLAIGLLDRFTRSPRLGGFAAYCVTAGLLMIFLGLRRTASPARSPTFPPRSPFGPPVPGGIRLDSVHSLEALVIELKDVHKGFEVKDKKTRKKKRIEAVRGISLCVKPGEIYGLLGPNGAGKSTTLRMIAGLMHPEQGSISVCGADTQKQPEVARGHVGYLSTDLNVYNRFTPRELLRLFGEFQGVDAGVAERRGMHLLEKLDLDEFVDVKMEGFSSGQRQKVSIARALLHDPKVIVFDEPTTGLDVLTAKTVLDLLRLMREEGRAVIVSTHVLPLVEQVCDRVGIIFDGLLHGDAPPRDILQKWRVGTLDEVFFALAADGGK